MNCLTAAAQQHAAQVTLVTRMRVAALISTVTAGVGTKSFLDTTEKGGSRAAPEINERQARDDAAVSIDGMGTNAGGC